MGAYTPIKMSTVGVSSPIIINLPAIATWQAQPAYSLGVVVTVSPGAVLTYTVQICAEPNPAASGSNWNAHDTLVSLTTSANGNIAFPITGLRLSVSGIAGGFVSLAVAQWP